MTSAISWGVIHGALNHFGCCTHQLLGLLEYFCQFYQFISGWFLTCYGSKEDWKLFEEFWFLEHIFRYLARAYRSVVYQHFPLGGVFSYVQGCGDPQKGLLVLRRRQDATFDFAPITGVATSENA